MSVKFQADFTVFTLTSKMYGRSQGLDNVPLHLKPAPPPTGHIQIKTQPGSTKWAPLSDSSDDSDNVLSIYASSMWCDNGNDAMVVLKQH